MSEHIPPQDQGNEPHTPDLTDEGVTSGPNQPIVNEDQRSFEDAVLFGDTRRDLKNYLATRVAEDPIGRSRDPQTGKFANPDKFYESRRAASEESSMPQAYEDMSIAELESLQAEANERKDKTSSMNISEVLGEKAKTLGKDMPLSELATTWAGAVFYEDKAVQEGAKAALEEKMESNLSLRDNDPKHNALREKRFWGNVDLFAGRELARLHREKQESDEAKAYAEPEAEPEPTAEPDVYAQKADTEDTSSAAESTAAKTTVEVPKFPDSKLGRFARLGAYVDKVLHNVGVYYYPKLPSEEEAAARRAARASVAASPSEDAETKQATAEAAEPAEAKPKGKGLAASFRAGVDAAAATHGGLRGLLDEAQEKALKAMDDNGFLVDDKEPKVKPAAAPSKEDQPAEDKSEKNAKKRNLGWAVLNLIGIYKDEGEPEKAKEEVAPSPAAVANSTDQNNKDAEPAAAPKRISTKRKRYVPVPSSKA